MDLASECTPRTIGVTSIAIATCKTVTTVVLFYLATREIKSIFYVSGTYQKKKGFWETC